MRVLITGGGGFLGGALTRRLLERGDQVRILARGDYPELVALGAEQVRADVADAEAFERAATDCDALIHTAAKVGWGPYAEFHRTNVVGTRNAITACRAAGVHRLVYTSTPSVVHTGGDVEGVDESVPYATHFDAHYPRTKVEAERLVLAANDRELSTVALRPHLIWGPGDTQLLPRFADRWRSGRLRLCSGPPKLVDTIFIDNAVDAHLLALDRLAPDAACAGRAYFISNGEPLAIDEVVNGVLATAGLGPVEKRVPAWAAFVAGAIAELVYATLRIRREPPITRFVARQLSTAHWFDISAARRDLGFEPRISFAQGLQRLRETAEKQ